LSDRELELSAFDQPLGGARQGLRLDERGFALAGAPAATASAATARMAARASSTL